MTKEEIRSYVKERVSASPDRPESVLDGWIEAARLRVASGDGRWAWTRLLRQSTLTVSADVTDYIFPAAGAEIEKPGKLLSIKGRLGSDQPVDFYTPEAFVAKRFNLPLEGVCVKGIAQDGTITLSFDDAPASGAILDVWYRADAKGSAGDTLFAFVPPENEDLFLYAALMVATLGSKFPEDVKTFQDSLVLYKDAMNAAILNDYSSSAEVRLIAPSKHFDVLQYELLRLNNER